MMENMFYTMGYPQAIAVSVAIICVTVIIYRILTYLRDCYEEHLLNKHTTKHILLYLSYIVLIVITCIGVVFYYGSMLRNVSHDNGCNVQECKCKNCNHGDRMVIEIHSKNDSYTCTKNE